MDDCITSADSSTMETCYCDQVHWILHGHIKVEFGRLGKEKNADVVWDSNDLHAFQLMPLPTQYLLLHSNPK